MYDQFYQTINHLNTPFNNPKLKDIKKVKVVDPTHPLFGHSFHVLEWRNSPGNEGFVYVEYRHLTRLYISIDATDIAFIPRIPATKLTCESILALTNLGMEILNLCLNHQNKSGSDYQKNNKMKS